MSFGVSTTESVVVIVELAVLAVGGGTPGGTRVSGCLVADGIAVNWLAGECSVGTSCGVEHPMKRKITIAAFDRVDCLSFVICCGQALIKIAHR